MKYKILDLIGREFKAFRNDVKGQSDSQKEKTDDDENGTTNLRSRQVL